MVLGAFTLNNRGLRESRVGVKGEGSQFIFVYLFCNKQW